MKTSLKFFAAITAIFAITTASSLQAQDADLDPSLEDAVDFDPSAEAIAEAGLVDSGDKSGTNPINFTVGA